MLAGARCLFFLRFAVAVRAAVAAVVGVGAAILVVAAILLVLCARRLVLSPRATRPIARFVATQAGWRRRWGGGQRDNREKSPPLCRRGFWFTHAAPILRSAAIPPVIS